MSSLVPLRTVDLLDRHRALNVWINLFSLPPHIVAMRITAYKREMRAVNATREAFETLLARGVLPPDMTMEELAPHWEAELAIQRTRF